MLEFVCGLLCGMALLILLILRFVKIKLCLSLCGNIPCDAPRQGAITFMPTPVTTPINLIAGAVYAVSQFVADGDGNPTGDALNKIAGTIKSGDAVTLTDNDTEDAVTNVNVSGAPGATATVEFNAVDSDNHAVRAIAEITAVVDDTVPIGGVLVWTRVD